MRPTSDTDTAPAAGPPERESAPNGRRAAEALMREHPDAIVYTQTADGLVVPPPASIGLEGCAVLETEGRNPMDLCVAEDRMGFVQAWLQVKREAVAEARGRLRSDPEQWMVVRMLDLRPTHGVIVNIAWPTDEGPAEQAATGAEAPLSLTPRFCSRKQDAEGNVIECDEAYLQMFGYSLEEVVGAPTFERVHPDDQARVIEGWITSVATGRVQMFRIRMKRKDGSWLWVDTTLHNFLGEAEQRHVLAECIDVSAEMAAQEALQDREELLRKLLEEMPDGLLQLDRERNVIYHNARLLEILHGSIEIIGGRTPGPPAAEPAQPPGQARLSLREMTATLTEEARRTFDAVLERAFAGAVREDVELEAEPAPGVQRNILVKVRPLQRDSGAVTGVIASVLDVTDTARARRELERRAAVDALTGAHNRASIMEALSSELEVSAETGVIYVDLDQFKSVNDTFGHAAGDEVIVHVAGCLKAAMRSSDELGRMGGDEFLVLLRGVANLEEAMRAAQRISDAVRGSYVFPDGCFHLRASVGVAFVEDPTVTAEQLVERADAAMYRSKEQRRGLPVLAA